MGGATSSPLYRAALEEMAGGLGSGRRRPASSGPSTPSRSTVVRFALVEGRKVAKRVLEERPSLYGLAHRWMQDTPMASHTPEPPLDVFNLPSPPPPPPLPPALSSEMRSAKRAKVDELVASPASRKNGQVEAEVLRANLLEHAKQERRRTLEQMRQAEIQCGARLTHLEETTTVRLRSSA